MARPPLFRPLLTRLTESANLVIMPSFDIPALKRLIEVTLEEYAPAEEPAKAKKRKRLVAAAQELFLQHGYRKTSVRDVASRAGVAKGTLYLYFPTKADLLLAALFEERRVVFDSFLPMLEEGIPGRVRLRLWLRNFVLSLREAPLSTRLLGHDQEMQLVLEDLDPSYLKQVFDMKIGFLAALIEDACEPEVSLGEAELRRRATVLIATFRAAGVFADAETRQGMELEVFTDTLCDVLLHGLCQPPEDAAAWKQAAESCAPATDASGASR